MKIKKYPITSKNSTVLGYPGTHLDWSKFDWKGETFAPTKLSRGITTERRAPKPWIDGNAKEYYEYLHVPFEWSEHRTIYRVRPHFCVGQKRWGRIVTTVQAKEIDGVWYWVITLAKGVEVIG